MKQKYVSPQEILAESRRMNTIMEYQYFSGNMDEAEDQKDPLTMDDLNAEPPAGGEGQPPAPDAGAGAPPAPAPAEGGAGAQQPGAPPEDPFGQEGGAAPEGGMPQAGAPEAPMAGGDATEVDVTDIVQDTKAVNQKADTLVSSVEQTTAKVNELLTKINTLEQTVQKMDGAMTKIDAIYKQVELSKPPSPEEVKEAMAEKSYPFNVQLEKFGQENTPQTQTDLEKRKNKLSLSSLVGDFNEREVRNSFNPPDPFEEKLSRTLPAYRM